MAWWKRLALWAAARFSAVQFDSAPRPIDQMFLDMRRSSGSSIGRAEALTVPAVLKGRNMICSVATLPLMQRGPDNTAVPNSLLQQIDPDVPNVVTLSQTLEDLLFEGIAWWRVIAFGHDLYPVQACRVDPASVSLTPPLLTGGASLAPLPSGEDPRGAVVYIDGEEVGASEVIRFDSPNPGLLRVCGRAIRRAVLLDRAAEVYATDWRPLDYFSPADGADELDDADVEEVLADWAAARRKRSTGYVPRAINYNVVSTPTAADLQLVELQQRASLEIANGIGVDPEDLGVSTTSRTYSNDVDRRRNKVNDVLGAYMRAITDRLSMGDVTRRGYRVEFVLDDYLKSNPTERWSTYQTAINLGVKSVDEVRAEEGLPPGAPAPRPAPAPAPALAEDPAAVEAHRLAAMSFSGPDRLHFADVPVTGFSVDVGQRIIEGIALPWGKLGMKAGLKFRFERGSLVWADVSRVKLRREHVDPIGVATDIRDAPAGLRLSFRVARGPEGDRALELAEDGVLDGLSVGVEFDMATDAVPDPRNRGAVLVRRADLREVSLTSAPAFDDARVTRVTANRDGGTMNECATCGAPLTPGVAHTCPPAPAPAGVTLSADQLTALWGVPGVQAMLLGQPAAAAPAGPAPADPAAPADPGPTPVNPARITASVTEPAPYRLDRKGNLQPGSHDFSADLIAANAGDKAAADRATSWVRKQFDVASTDVNELNPTINRPEMYVDQRDYQYPIWSAISKGSLTSITPFTFPKFSSASGLVANHTEGNEPSSGTLVTTSQTVTPTPVSGKAKITRDTWDQGGNPQVSALIWRQMTKAWFEALEAFAVSTLDAASPTQIDLSGTPGLADDDLDQALTEAFVALQFIRGGFSMDTGFAQVDFYKALAAATDGTGRRLYPALGPTNATGTVGARWGRIDVNGVGFLPGWALAATGSVAASSYLFDREVVHGWASSPQRLDFDIEVAHVYIGLWGYKAAAISDIAGVREIVYDPA